MNMAPTSRRLWLKDFERAMLPRAAVLPILRRQTSQVEAWDAAQDQVLKSRAKTKEPATGATHISKDQKPVAPPCPIHSFLPREAFLRVRWCRRNCLREGKITLRSSFIFELNTDPKEIELTLERITKIPKKETIFIHLTKPLFCHH